MFGPLCAAEAVAPEGAVVGAVEAAAGAAEAPPLEEEVDNKLESQAVIGSTRSRIPSTRTIIRLHNRFIMFIS
jgi:hypothetical protein